MIMSDMKNLNQKVMNVSFQDTLLLSRAYNKRMKPTQESINVVVHDRPHEITDYRTSSELEKMDGMESHNMEKEKKKVST